MRTSRHFPDTCRLVYLAALALIAGGAVACGDDSSEAAGGTGGSSAATTSAETGSSSGAGGAVDETPLPELRLAAIPTQVVPAGAMTHARASHTATLLDDGTVVVIGGEDLGADRSQLDTVERFDPATNAWTELPALPEGRLNHSATLLVDGKILIVGGGGTNDIGSPSGLDVVETALLLDPATGATEIIAGPSEPRHGHLAVRLPSGKVLIAGGADADSELVHAAGAGADIPFGHPLASAEIYDPETKTFSPTGSMSIAHSSFTLIGLADGRVLASGGISNLEDDESSAVNEVYDETTGAFTLVGAFDGDDRLHHAGTRLADGRALIYGGKKANVSFLDDLQVLDPATGVFSRFGQTGSTRTVANVVPTADGGAIVLAGLHCGIGGCEVPTTTRIVGADGQDRPGPELLDGRAGSTATVLPDGSILVAGGYANTSMASVERLMP